MSRTGISPSTYGSVGLSPFLTAKCWYIHSLITTSCTTQTTGRSSRKWTSRIRREWCLRRCIKKLTRRHTDLAP